MLVKPRILPIITPHVNTSSIQVHGTYIIGLILILFVVMFIYNHFSSCVLCKQ